MLLFIEQQAVPMPGRHQTRSPVMLEGICSACTDGAGLCPSAPDAPRGRQRAPCGHQAT